MRLGSRCSCLSVFNLAIAYYFFRVNVEIPIKNIGCCGVNVASKNQPAVMFYCLPGFGRTFGVNFELACEYEFSFDRINFFLFHFSLFFELLCYSFF